MSILDIILFLVAIACLTLAGIKANRRDYQSAVFFTLAAVTALMLVILTPRSV